MSTRQLITPCNAQADKEYDRCKQRFQHYENQSKYDVVSRDNGLWHGDGESILTSPQAYQETSLYSVIREEEKLHPVVATDTNKELRSPVYPSIQAENLSSGTSNSLNVNCNEKLLAGMNTNNRKVRARRYWVWPMAFITCCTMLLLLLIVVAVATFSQMSVMKSQYTSFQKRLSDNITSNLIPELQSIISTSELSLYNNISHLQNVLLDTVKDFNTLIKGVNLTWGMNYSIINYLYQADNSFNRVIDTMVQLGTSAAYPASSCGNILAVKIASPSGMYWLRSSNGSSVSVFCDMNLTCDGVGGGWTRLGRFNASKQCPENFTAETIDMEHTCVPVRSGAGCTSIYFPSHIVYSRICGEIRGIGIRSPDGFRSDQIDYNYVDGISITYGTSMRKHIWTYVAKHRDSENTCSCSNGKPEFVGEHFDCMEVVATEPYFNCECPYCSTNFHVSLPEATMDVIEIRICTDQDSTDEQVGIRFADINIQ